MVICGAVRLRLTRSSQLQQHSLPILRHPHSLCTLRNQHSQLTLGNLLNPHS